MLVNLRRNAGEEFCWESHDDLNRENHGFSVVRAPPPNCLAALLYAQRLCRGHRANNFSKTYRRRRNNHARGATRRFRDAVTSLISHFAALSAGYHFSLFTGVEPMGFLDTRRTIPLLHAPPGARPMGFPVTWDTTGTARKSNAIPVVHCPKFEYCALRYQRSRRGRV